MSLRIEKDLIEIKQKLIDLEKLIDNHILTAIKSLDKKVFQLMITLIGIGLGGGGIVAFLITQLGK